MSKKFLILAEHKNGELKKASLELLKATESGERYALIIGSKAQAAADSLAKHGCKKVFWIAEPSFDAYHPEAYLQAIESAVKESSAEIVLGSASALGKDVMPRLAVRLDAAFAQDCTSLELSGAVTLTRAFYSGKTMAKLELSGAKAVITMRPNSLPAATESAGGEVQKLSPNFDFGSSSIQFVSKTEAKSTRPDLTEANIIVSGGRSLKSRENFKIIFDCADALGAAVGASRAACDEGLADHDMQVGQTGKTVNPSLYIACGISGAIQHLAGMRTSKVIVAVNKDANAPIFSKATYGIVGDLFEVVPELTKQAKAMLSKA